MAGEGRVAFCVDECLGHTLAETLRALRAPGAPHIYGMRELGFSAAKDEVWLGALPQRGVHTVVTRDSRILRASVRREVWRAAGLTLFILDAPWSDLRLFDQARGLIWWWPAIVRQAGAGPAGSAWRVPLPPTHVPEMVRLFADAAAPDLTA